MHWAIKVMTDENDREKPFLNIHWPWAAAGIMGFAASVSFNYLTRRPPFAGIQRHIAVSVALAYAGLKIDQYKEESMAERDAIVRHYIELHPDDFPEPDRKKYSQVLLPWVPIR